MSNTMPESIPTDFPAYTASMTHYVRRRATEVNIGEVPLGGNYPIRLQSMTTTDTMDTQATVAQSIRMIEAGCEYVRITAPSLKEAENLRLIKAELRRQGYKAPIVADIHFTPNAAELAAKIVEKVRINPGNYIDKKKFEIREYTDVQYVAELDRIRERFSPLVKICKEYGTAMRIGTNHGSLSDRIMNRYGDSPEGMVESAMEFLRICSEMDYHQIVLSMKSSNPLVMIQAYRQLIVAMEAEGMHYPLHLGVTEAGGEEEGRIKSSLGIGSLLEDGIGDTIRVSLTEDPEFEIPVARSIAFRHPESVITEETSAIQAEDALHIQHNPYSYMRRHSVEVLNFGGTNVPRVIADFSGFGTAVSPESLSVIDYRYEAESDKWHQGDQGADYIFSGDVQPDFMLPNGSKNILQLKAWQAQPDRLNTFPLITADQLFLSRADAFPSAVFIALEAENISDALIAELSEARNAVIVLSTKAEYALTSLRTAFFRFENAQMRQPVIVRSVYSDALSEEEFILRAATDVGGLLAEGFGDGTWLGYRSGTHALINRTSFNILQAARTRISRTEYISCPSCGRTLFDLQETTSMIRQRTDHLKGVKIAIMGCIVNGPGEMADADYGYVGTGTDRITLYRGKDIIKRNIHSDAALDELIGLIREDGRWLERAEIMSL